MKTGSFEVHISDHSSSVDEWRKAQQASLSDLPQLTDEQKSVARKFGITDEEYARNVLAGSSGLKRMHERAVGLGKAVQDILESLGREDRVVAVSRDMDTVGWIVRIETQQRDVDVRVSQELTDDLLDSGSTEERQRLKVRVLSSLGLDAAISRH